MAINAYNGDGGKGLERLLGIVSTLSNMGILPGETKNRAPLIDKQLQETDSKIRQNEEQTRGYKLKNDFDQKENSDEIDGEDDNEKLALISFIHRNNALRERQGLQTPEDTARIEGSLYKDITTPRPENAEGPSLENGDYGTGRKIAVSRAFLKKTLEGNQIQDISTNVLAQNSDNYRARLSANTALNRLVNDTNKRLPADKVLGVNEGKNAINMLNDLSGTINENKAIFGPVSGNLASINPYNETGATINSQMKIASQSIGKFLEGGVLRKEDEDKYRKMLPQLSDTPEVSKNKLQLVDRMLKNKLAADIKALNDSGYDATGLMGGVSDAPGLPSVIRKQKVAENGNSVIPNANADSHPMDIRAVDWAKKNPKDPRSVKILKANGVIK